MTQEMPVSPDQSAEIDAKVERVRQSVVRTTFAALAKIDPTIRDKFEASRETILGAIFPSGDGRNDLGLSYKAGRRVLDEISDALATDFMDTIYPPAVPKIPGPGSA